MAVQIAVSTNSFGPFSLAGALEVLPALGLTLLQVPIRHPEDMVPAIAPPIVSVGNSAADLEATQRTIESAGLHIVSGHVGFEHPLEPGAVGRMIQKLDLAQQLGAKCVVGSAGHADDERMLQSLYAALNRIGDAAADRGLIYCCDVQPGVCGDHRQMLRTMADLAHPAICLNFDPGLLLYYNHNPTVEVSLAKVCHLVRHVQLRDSSGEQGDGHFPPLGYGGGVDFLRVYQLLRDTGFRGPYSICLDPAADEEPRTLVEYRERLRNSLATLKSCGFF